MRKKPPVQAVLVNSTKTNRGVKQRILFYDLEVSASLGWVWRKWATDVIEFDKEWYILSIAYKWDSGPIHVKALPDFPRYKRDPEDDSELVKFIHKLFEEASFTVAHNNRRFDYKKSNTRFIEHGLPPPAPYKVIDTFVTAKKHFKFLSNSLDDLARVLKVGRKLKAPYDVWRGCIQGDMKSWKQMKRYNRHDVYLLYGVYLKLLPWMDGHTVGNFGCPKCNSTNLQSRGTRVTIGKKYRRYQCTDCGGWCSDRQGEQIQKALVSL